MVIAFTRHAARTSADAERVTEILSTGAHDGAWNPRVRGQDRRTGAPGFWARVGRAVGHSIGVPEAGHLGRDLLAL